MSIPLPLTPLLSPLNIIPLIPPVLPLPAFPPQPSPHPNNPNRNANTPQKPGFEPCVYPAQFASSQLLDPFPDHGPWDHAAQHQCGGNDVCAAELSDD